MKSPTKSPIMSPTMPFDPMIPDTALPEPFHPQVMISGYYGFDNLGDELILYVLVEELKRQGAQVLVLSNNPQKTREDYGVRAIHRLALLEIIDELAHTQLLISGGGGLFQDVTGPMSPLYYGGIIHLANYFEVPVSFFAQGVGPLTRQVSRMLAQSAFRRCETMTVRDEESADLVEALIDTRPEVTADPVWLLDIDRLVGTRLGAPLRDTWNVGISLRPWPDLTEARLKKFADFLKELIEGSSRQVRFVLLPFQVGTDRPILEKLAHYLKDAPDGVDMVVDMVHETDVLREIAHCDVLFGMRFHSLMLGVLSNVAVYGLVYDPKVRMLLRRLGLEGTDVSMLEQLNSDTVRDYFGRYPAVNLTELKQQAYRNFERVLPVLYRPDPAELIG